MAHSETSFTYSIYVQAAPEQVWRALTDRTYTRQFWRHSTMGGKTFPSDWRKGSTWELVHEDVGLVSGRRAGRSRKPTPRTVSRTRGIPSHRNGRRSPASTSLRPAWRAEPRSNVAYKLGERGAGVVRLTVTHDGFGPESRVSAAISEGWPAVFSSLKTLLETAFRSRRRRALSPAP